MMNLISDEQLAKDFTVAIIGRDDFHIDFTNDAGIAYRVLSLYESFILAIKAKNAKKMAGQKLSPRR
jgi:hypothetical protein